jgi:hypothetical protein
MRKTAISLATTAPRPIARASMCVGAVGLDALNVAKSQHQRMFMTSPFTRDPQSRRLLLFSDRKNP